MVNYAFSISSASTFDRSVFLASSPENVSGSAVVQRPAYSPGDVLQHEVMILEVGQLFPDLLERGLWILEGGHVDVPPVRFPAWANFITRLRSGRSPSVGGGCSRRRLRNGGVAQ